MSFSYALNAIKFEDVRSQIVEYLKENSEFSGQFDFTASNIGIIIDSMAYVTMLMSYQVSNISSNMFLDSTTLRQNAVSIAKTMGYRPKRAISSKIIGTIEYINDTPLSNTDYLKILSNTEFLTDTGYTYINTDEIKLVQDANNPNILS